MRQEYPYRECIHCESVKDCRNMQVEELTGKPMPPDDCIRKEAIDLEIKKHYEKP